MIYNYHNEFLMAVKNTKSLGFDLEFKSFLERQYFKNNAEELLSVIMPVLIETINDTPMISPKIFMHTLTNNCGPVHYFIKPLIEKTFHCKTFITTGIVSEKVAGIQEEHAYYSLTLDHIKDSITKKTHFNSSHHTWLTLDSGEIFDLVFLTREMRDNHFLDYQLSLSRGILPIRPKYGFLNKESKRNLRYHPIVIGETILKKAQYDLPALSSIISSKNPLDILLQMDDSLVLEDIDTHKNNPNSHLKNLLYQIKKTFFHKI